MLCLLLLIAFAYCAYTTITLKIKVPNRGNIDLRVLSYGDYTVHKWEDDSSQEFANLLIYDQTNSIEPKLIFNRKITFICNHEDVCDADIYIDTVPNL